MKRHAPNAMRCLACSKVVPRLTTTHHAPGPPGQPIAGWTYQGPGTVTNKRFASVMLPSGQSQPRLWCVFVWDGKSYDPKFGHFCSLRCAGRYGQAAADAGWLRPTRDV